MTAQISNTSYGDAPATRAQVVLTPAGVTPGTGSDVTIGSIAVPAIAAWQTTNVEQTITLPVDTSPDAHGQDSQFNLSVMPDADFLTNDVYPHTVTGIPGTDIAPVTVNVPAGTTPPALGPTSGPRGRSGDSDSDNPVLGSQLPGHRPWFRISGTPIRDPSA